MIGETIKDFKITQRLGGGGMGEVWVGEQQMVQTRVAIKLLRPEVSTDRQHVQRFFNEAVAVARIKHAGIVKIFDVGFHAGRAFLIMELLEGETLAARIARTGSLPIEQVAEIGRQIASILEATHAAGVIHRDLKPENVFLTSDAELASQERVKILDFGVAKLGTGLTATGDSMGTPSYMAPEVWANASKADASADVYALGCLVFEMCRGQPPFPATWVGEAYTKHANEPPPRVGSGSRELDELVAQMLAKSPAERPAVPEIRALFARLAEAPSRTAGARASAASSPKKLGSLAIAGLAAAGLAAVGAVVVVSLRGDRPPPDAVVTPEQPSPRVASTTPAADAEPPPPPPNPDSSADPSADPSGGDSTEDDRPAPPGSAIDLERRPRLSPTPRTSSPPPASRPAPARPSPAAATIDERDPKALLRQGKLHEKSGNWQAAREAYQKLEKIKGYTGIALYQQALVALLTNDTELAIQLAIRSAMQPGPHKTDAKFLYGDALYKQGEYRRAKDIYLVLHKTLTGELRATATRKIMATNRALRLPEDDGIVGD